MPSRARLDAGAQRLGWIKLTNAEQLPALLIRADDNVRVEIITRTTAFEEGDPLLERPSDHVNFGAQGALFVDSHGTVELSGLVPVSSTESWGSLPNAATLSVSKAVINGNGKTLATLQGVRTDHPALDTWMFVRNITDRFSGGDDQGDWMQYKMEDATTITIEEGGSLEIWSYPVAEPREMQGVTLRSKTQLYSASEDSIDLNHTLQRHKFVSNLLSVLYGDVVSSGEQWVAGAENPIKVLGGEVLPGQNWCPIIFSGQPSDASDPGFHDFLVRYSEAGPGTLGRWLKLNEELKDGVDAFLMALPSAGAEWEGRLVSIAIAFERIGYAVEQGVSPERRRRNLTFIDCVKNVCLDSEEIVFRRPELWADRFRLAYRGIKHADRTRPEPEEVAKVVVVAIDVLRLWFVQRLGCIEKIEEHWWRRLYLFHHWFRAAYDDEEAEWWGGEFRARDALEI